MKKKPVIKKLHIPKSNRALTHPVEMREKTHMLVLKRIAITNGLKGSKDIEKDTGVINASIQYRYAVYNGEMTYAAYLREMQALLLELGYGEITNMKRNTELEENDDPRIGRIRTRSNAIIFNYNNRNGIRTSKDQEYLKWLNLDLKHKATYGLIKVEEYETKINDYLKRRGYKTICSEREKRKREFFLYPGLVLGENIELIKTVPSKTRNNKDWVCKCRLCDSNFVADSTKVLRLTNCGCVKQNAKERKTLFKTYPYSFYKALFGELDVKEYPKSKNPLELFGDKLKQHELEVLSMIFVDEKKMSVIAKEKNTTRQYIHQIKTKALSKIEPSKSLIFSHKR